MLRCSCKIPVLSKSTVAGVSPLCESGSGWKRFVDEGGLEETYPASALLSPASSSHLPYKPATRSSLRIFSRSVTEDNSSDAPSASSSLLSSAACFRTVAVNSVASAARPSRCAASLSYRHANASSTFLSTLSKSESHAEASMAPPSSRRAPEKRVLRSAKLRTYSQKATTLTRIWRIYSQKDTPSISL